MSARAGTATIAWKLLGVCVACAYSSSAIAQATTCTASTTGVAFGTYDPRSPSPSDGVGDVSVTCSADTSYTIALSPGQGSFAARAMFSGSHALNYNLFTDTLRTTIWGDGSGSTATVAGSGTNTFHVYGRIPALQNPYVGSYADAVIITVNF